MILGSRVVAVLMTRGGVISTPISNAHHRIMAYSFPSPHPSARFPGVRRSLFPLNIVAHRSLQDSPYLHPSAHLQPTYQPTYQPTTAYYPQSQSQSHAYYPPAHSHHSHSRPRSHSHSHYHPPAHSHTSTHSHSRPRSHSRPPSRVRSHSRPPSRSHSPAYSHSRSHAHYHSHPPRERTVSIGDRVRQFFGVDPAYHHAYGDHHRERRNSFSGFRDASRPHRSNSTRTGPLFLGSVDNRAYFDTYGRQVDHRGRVIHRM